MGVFGFGMFNSVLNKLSSIKFTRSQQKEIDEVVRKIHLICDVLEEDEEEREKEKRDRNPITLGSATMDDIIGEIQSRGMPGGMPE